MTRSHLADFVRRANGVKRLEKRLPRGRQRSNASAPNKIVNSSAETGAVQNTIPRRTTSRLALPPHPLSGKASSLLTSSAIVHVELGVDQAAVLVRGVFANAEPLGDRLVRRTASHSSTHFRLASAECKAANGF